MSEGVDWQEYLRFFTESRTSQTPLDPAEREQIACLAADILQLSEADRKPVWGVASPPGRYAQTVIHLRRGLSLGHAVYQARAAALDIEEIGLKVFKANADAGRLAAGLVPFQERRAQQGRPLQDCASIQKVVGAGWHVDSRQGRRAFLIQEWISGATLEENHRRVWPKTPLPGPQAQRLLASLYREIVLPVWSALAENSGIVWDWRDAQLVVEEEARLVLIDSDCLEELAAQRSPEQRRRQEQNAFRRLRAMTARLLKAQGLPQSETTIRATVQRAWDAAGLGGPEREAPGAGALCALGRIAAPTPQEQAAAGERIERFLALLHEAGLLSGGGPPDLFSQRAPPKERACKPLPYSIKKAISTCWATPKAISPAAAWSRQSPPNRKR
ncbi:MAG TPA: hypothetical protein VKT32_07040 [Chthonomonadaceae bacterium]|nr:hypothetical protein [Chthonomonadaceae bacterium]